MVPQEVHPDIEIVLGVLTAVEKNSRVTQRSVSQDLGIALGLTNAYLKRCVKKGLIKVQSAPANRYAYYLTPKGFSEKSKLTAEFLSQGFRYFRLARQQIHALYNLCEEHEWNQIILHGLTDLTEIAVMCAKDRPIVIKGIIDRSTRRSSYDNYPVCSGFDAAPHFEAILITDMGSAQDGFDAAVRVVESSRVFVPDLLNVTRNFDNGEGGLLGNGE